MEFRKFFKSGKHFFRGLLSERRHYMRYSSIPNDTFPIPMPVMNVLNMISPSLHGRVLAWIFTEGLRQTLVKRREFAKYVSAYLSKQSGQPVDVPQDGVFSEAALEQIPGLANIIDELEKEWLVRYEPRTITLPGRSGNAAQIVAIDLRDINALLLRQGKTPLYFGGRNGLIEYIEQGNWREHPIHKNPEFGKQGINLSLDEGSDGLREDPETGRKFFCFGLDADPQGSGETRSPCSFQPPMYSSHWSKRLDFSEKVSSEMLKQVVDVVSQGGSIDDLELPEIEWLRQLVDDGQITKESLTSRDALLKDVLNIIDRGVSGGEVQQAGGDANDWINAKAAVKANLMYMLSFPAEIDPESQQPSETTTNALGNSKTGKFMPAEITVSGKRGKLNLADPQWEDLNDNPAKQEMAADILTDLIFNEKDGTIARKISWTRGGRSYYKDRTVPSMLSTARSSGLAVTSAQTTSAITPDVFQKLLDSGWMPNEDPKKAGKLLTLSHPDGKIMHLRRNAKNGEWYKVQEQGNDVAVKYKGQKISVPRSELFERMEQSKKHIFTTPGVQVSHFAPTSEKPLEFDKLLQQGWVPHDKRYQAETMDQIPDDVMVTKIVLPGANIVKKIARMSPDTPWVEVVPEGSHVANVKNYIEQGYEASYLGEHEKFLRLYHPELGDEKILKRKIVDGKDVWMYVTPPKKSSLTNPYITGLFATVNTGQGQTMRIGYSSQKNQAEWEAFMNNLEDYGDRRSTKYPDLPVSVTAGYQGVEVGRGQRAEDYLSSATMAVADRIADIRFRHGDLKKRSGEDIYKLLAEAGLKPEEIEQVIPAIQESIFNNQQWAEPHTGQELFVAPNMFRQDVFQAILRNGWLWRKRAAASAIRSDARREYDARQVGRGQGGSAGSDEEEFDPMSMIQAPEEDEEMGYLQDIGYDDDEKIGRHDDTDDEYGSGFQIDDLSSAGGSYDDDVDKLIAQLQARKDKGEDVSQEYEKLRRGRKRSDLSKGKQFNLGTSAGGNIGGDEEGPIIGRKRTDDLAGRTVPVFAPHKVQNQLPQIGGAASQARPQQIAPSAPAPQKRPVSSFDDDEPVVKKPKSGLFDHVLMKSYSQWLAETEVVYDPKAAKKKGRTFNVWGAPPQGRVPQKSIDGEADTAKEDPTGKKGIR